MKIQKIKTELPQGQQRIETGPLQINDDWPGTFIRGDNAAYYSHTLKSFLERLHEVGVVIEPLGEFGVLNSLVNDLSSSTI